MYNAYGNYVGGAGIYSISNGQQMPKFVEITSPIQGGSIASLPSTITGKIYDPTSSGYTPAYLMAWVCDDYTCARYSSDPMRIQSGWKAMTYTPASGGTQASFSVPVAVGDVTLGGMYPLYIEVDTIDDMNTWHWDYIYVNDTNNFGWGEGYGKPGTQPSIAPPNDQRLRSDRIIKLMREHDAAKGR